MCLYVCNHTQISIKSLLKVLKLGLGKMTGKRLVKILCQPTIPMLIYNGGRGECVHVCACIQASVVKISVFVL